MEAFRKQAAKFQQQVQKQQAAVLGKLHSGTPKEAPTTVVVDEAELQRFQQIDRLNNSTTAGKALQKDIVKGIEGLNTTGQKYAEIGTKLAEDCRKYGLEGPGVGTALAKATISYGSARATLERERDTFHRALQNQVAEPLKAMITGAPLEDARHLFRRYEKLREEATAQAGSVQRRTDRARGPMSDPTTAEKLREAEHRMGELTAAMAVLGRETASSLTSVEAQQQRLTLQRLIDLVKSEREFYVRSAELLDQLHAQLLADRQKTESQPPTPMGGERENAFEQTGAVPRFNVNNTAKALYFLAEVMHPFNAEAESELSLQVGEYVVVRQVSETGWSEGECKGRAGWFPSAYVEQRQKVPINKVVEGGQNVAPNVA